MKKTEFLILLKLSKITKVLDALTETEPDSLITKTMFFSFGHKLFYEKTNFQHL